MGILVNDNIAHELSAVCQTEFLEQQLYDEPKDFSRRRL